MSFECVNENVSKVISVDCLSESLRSKRQVYDDDLELLSRTVCFSEHANAERVYLHSLRFDL